MAKMIDNQCNVEFASDADYLKHKKAGHKGGLEKAIPIEAPPVPTPPPGVPKEAMPSAEFMEQVARIESSGEKPASSDSAASQHPSELPKPNPLVLTYLWIGQCPDDRTEASTFELDVADKHFCIAVCPTCKKQLDTKEVAKL